MANQTIRRGPKRRIERVSSTVYHWATNSITTKALHTAEDAKTLVRMRIQGAITNDIATGTINSFTFTVAVAPSGSAISSCNPAIGEDLDNDVAEQLLIRNVDAFSINDEAHFIDIDSKAMRKLKPGDILNYKDLCGQANGSDVFLLVTMWFKE